MKKIVVLSGAGISAESGIATFRDSDGLWEGHNVMEVATPEGFAKNPALVLEFYNQRRRLGKNAKPNEAHFALKRLEEFFEVHKTLTICTNKQVLAMFCTFTVNFLR
jgi:NAD-dependent deacetylase